MRNRVYPEGYVLKLGRWSYSICSFRYIKKHKIDYEQQNQRTGQQNQ